MKGGKGRGGGGGGVGVCVGGRVRVCGCVWVYVCGSVFICEINSTLIMCVLWILLLNPKKSIVSPPSLSLSLSRYLGYLVPLSSRTAGVSRPLGILHNRRAPGPLFMYAKAPDRCRGNRCQEPLTGGCVCVAGCGRGR